MKYFSLFGYSKPVIGMLHLKKDSSMGMLERAQRETLCYLNSGVEAILVENYFGSTSDCEIVLQWLQRERSEAIYGVNILGNMGESFRLDLAPENRTSYNVRKERKRLTKELKEDGKKELHSRANHRQAAGSRTALQPGENDRRGL